MSMDLLSSYGVWEKGRGLRLTHQLDRIRPVAGEARPGGAQFGQLSLDMPHDSYGMSGRTGYSMLDQTAGTTPALIIQV